MKDFFSHLHIYCAVALVGMLAGFALGYRYAEGRCAAAALERQEVVEQALTGALDKASGQIETANDNAAAAARKSAALDAAQVKERIVYVQAPAAPDCRLDDGAYRLLVDAIRRANGRDSARYPD